MERTDTIRRTGWTRVLLFVIVASMIIAACSSSGDDSAALTALDEGGVGEEAGYGDQAPGDIPATAFGGEGTYAVRTDNGSVYFTEVAAFDAKIIRDGSLDLRIEPGAFGTSVGQLRAIADDLGGYLASGESHIEEYDEERYAVGWYTLRIPSDRFDDAVARIEGLGERVAASITSQDVTEEYVDLEGRLDYWREQEAFYVRLLDEATAIEDLVTIQTRMQDVLLNIEQIEGRLRYLDSRTDFATLTVGLTEVPSVLAPTSAAGDPGPIEEAFDQAGDVLLATVGFLIVSAAVAIPIAMVVLFGFGVYKLFTRSSRREHPVEG